VQRTARLCASLALLALAVGCGRGAPKDAAPAPPRPLAAFAAQPVILTPVSHVRADTLGLVQQLGGARLTGRKLDSSVVAALEERGIARRWVLPADLARSHERNRTYATDPYQLAVEPLRASAFVAGSRFGEPLSSQLRTMIALHGESRYVLLPIEFRLERDGAAARGVLKAALVDPRFAQATWVGEVKGDPVASPAQALANVAARLADLFVAP
jgi:hypothetical protein